jgi:sirohydrochlorin ferrochelatase
VTGVLVLAHGSRKNDTEITMEKIVEYVREELRIELIVAAYMEFRAVSMESGFLELMEKGVNDIKVVPYFLFEGVHIREDIPQAIAAFRENHPEVQITLGKTLGTDRRLANVLADRVREALQ